VQAPKQGDVDADPVVCASFLVEHHFTGWNQVSATLQLLTWLAARTTTLGLGTAVLVLPWHNPVLLAEQAETLDLMSGGRLHFGIGKGYRHTEFDPMQVVVARDIFVVDNGREREAAIERNNRAHQRTLSVSRARPSGWLAHNLARVGPTTPTHS
jgi:alkanesulfonate monooxygenase SsuD/methylene tetrahydromethanopterin reductase-like flavin-dependent oxidoreductase (luciferase family)